MLDGATKLANEVKKEVAKELFTEIVNHRPEPFLTGSYMASHTIGINEQNTDEIVFEKVGQITPLGAKAISMLQLPTIEESKPGDIINISNSVGAATKGFSWAKKVEFAGWANKGPYMVYNLAVQKVVPKIPGIIDKVSERLGRESK